MICSILSSSSARSIDQFLPTRDPSTATADYTELQRNASSIGRTLSFERTESNCQLKSHAVLANLAHAFEANATALAAATRRFYIHTRTSMDIRGATAARLAGGALME